MEKTAELPKDESLVRSVFYFSGNCWRKNSNHFFRLKEETKMKRDLLLVMMMVVILIMGNQVYATTITYDLANLGGNRWEYTYSVANDSLISAIEEFTIYFNLGSYDNLTVGSTPADWDAIRFNPDPDIPDDGAYDALALFQGIASGSSLGGFSVSFDWLVAGIPGSQPFDVVNPSPWGVLDSGWTVPSTPVPEPGTLLLLGPTLIGLIGFGKRLRIKA
jgi:hypothetical protein